MKRRKPLNEKQAASKALKEVKRAEKKAKEAEERQKMFALFEALWAKLPYHKQCWACGAPVYGENLSLYWDHLLEKGKYPEYLLEEWNLFFCCWQCHTRKGNKHPHPNHQAAIDRAWERANRENEPEND